MYLREVFADFQGAFYKKHLEARFGTQFQLFMINNKKHGVAVLFCVSIISWGVCPKPRHKGLFVKSPLESQKLRQSKVRYLGEVFTDF